MEPSSSCQLSRQEFETACKAFISPPDSDGSKSEALGAHLIRRGWRWEEHSAVPGLGFMTRSPLVRHLRSTPSDESAPFDDVPEDADLSSVDEPPDPAAAKSGTGTFLGSGPDQKAVEVLFNVLYSDTYRVPALFFTASHRDSGGTLALDDLLRSTIFINHRASASSSAPYPFNTLSPPATSSDPDAPLVLPFLTVVEHPARGTACWAVHPCNTANLLRDVVGGEADGLKGVQYLEVWLAIVGSLIDLREGR